MLFRCFLKTNSILLIWFLLSKLYICKVTLYYNTYDPSKESAITILNWKIKRSYFSISIIIEKISKKKFNSSVLTKLNGKNWKEFTEITTTKIFNLQTAVYLSPPSSELKFTKIKGCMEPPSYSRKCCRISCRLVLRCKKRLPSTTRLLKTKKYF